MVGLVEWRRLGTRSLLVRWISLAYILNDDALKAKAQQWIEWSINNQKANGNFGTQPLEVGYKRIEGTQQDKREDW